MRDLVKLTLAEQIYTILKDDIISQEIKCGEKLTLKALQERFDISSTPIRDAMNRLNQDGLIDHVTNVGAKVIDLSNDHIREVYDFCNILDTAALKLAFNNENASDFSSKLMDSINAQETALNIEDIKTFRTNSDDFHDIFFRYANNNMLYAAALKVRNQLSLLANKYQDFHISKDVIFAEHKAIAAAIQSGKPADAERLLQEHFEHGKTYMLECISKK